MTSTRTKGVIQDIEPFIVTFISMFEEKSSFEVFCKIDDCFRNTYCVEIANCLTNWQIDKRRQGGALKVMVDYHLGGQLLTEGNIALLTGDAFVILTSATSLHVGQILMESISEAKLQGRAGKVPVLLECIDVDRIQSTISNQEYVKRKSSNTGQDADRERGRRSVKAQGNHFEDMNLSDGELRTFNSSFRRDTQSGPPTQYPLKNGHQITNTCKDESRTEGKGDADKRRNRECLNSYLNKFQEMCIATKDIDKRLSKLNAESDRIFKPMSQDSHRTPVQQHGPHYCAKRVLSSISKTLQSTFLPSLMNNSGHTSAISDFQKRARETLQTIPKSNENAIDKLVNLSHLDTPSYTKENLAVSPTPSGINRYKFPKILQEMRSERNGQEFSKNILMTTVTENVTVDEIFEDLCQILLDKSCDRSNLIKYRFPTVS